MSKKGGDTCCPTACTVSSSKSVCAKRVSGWVLLVTIVTLCVYGVSKLVSMRSETHVEEVLEINGVIEEWDAGYQAQVEAWKPSLVSEEGNEYPFEEINTVDFSAQFSDLNQYKPVKYNIQDIKEVVEKQTSEVVSDGKDGSFNVTTNLLVKFDNGESLTLEKVPLYTKKRSVRSKKDCVLNNVGMWNTTDNVCYTFSQLVRACYIIDSDNFPNLTATYDSFPCDEINRHYASFTFYRWTDAETNPTFSEFHSAHNITIILRSSKDPYVVGYTEVDLVKHKENNIMILFAALVGVVALFSLYIPLRLIMTEDEYATVSTGEKLRFMRRV